MVWLIVLLNLDMLVREDVRKDVWSEIIQQVTIGIMVRNNDMIMGKKLCRPTCLR